MNPDFLSLADVMEIHALQLERYGGGDGIRDEGLLSSALAQPMATFDGDFVHTNLFAITNAYLFHIVCNHPFVDKNKRTDLLATLVFLDISGITIEDASDDLYELTMGVADGSIDKETVIERVRTIAHAG